MKEKIINNLQDFENTVLENLTIFIAILIFALIGFNCFGMISLEYMLTGVGAIIAFWYGYKKYERDKELEFLINRNLKSNNIYDWIEIYYLHKKGYIDDNLFELLERINGNYLHKILEGIINNSDDELFINNEILDYISEGIQFGEFGEYFINQIEQYRDLQKRMLDSQVTIFKNEDKNKKLMKEIEKKYNYSKSLIETFKKIIK